MRVAGIGCRKSVTVSDVLAAVEAALAALSQQHRPAPSLVNSRDLGVAQGQEFTFSPAKGERDTSRLRFSTIPASESGSVEADAYLPLGGGESDFNTLAGAQRKLSVSNRKRGGFPVSPEDPCRCTDGAQPPRMKIDALATSAMKACEPAIAAAAEALRIPLVTVQEPDLQRAAGRGITRSAASLAATGIPSLAEAAALAAAGEASRLLGPRVATGNVTCAIAQTKDET